MTIYDNSAAAALRIINRFSNPKSTLTVERKTKTPDGAGGNAVSWASIATGVKCAVVPLSGTEQLQLNRLNHVATHAVYAVYSDVATITTDDRLVFDGRVFNIIDPRNVGEADAVMRIIADEGTGS